VIRPRVGESPFAVRLPLSTGATAFSYVLGVWLIGGVSGLPLLFATKLPGWTVYPLGILAAGWLFGVLFLPFQLRKLRASDLVFREREIEILSGPSGGKKIPRDKAYLRMEYATEPDAVISVGTLLYNYDTLAEADDPEELRSLEAIVDIAWPDGADDPIEETNARERAEQNPEESGGIACASCGAPARPTADETTRCRACGASQAVPDDVRAAVDAERALAEARVRSDRAVRGLLHQPRPWRVNLALALCSIPVVVTWPVLGAFFDEFYQCREVFQWTHGIPVFLGGLGISSGGLMFVRAQIEGRIAHRVLVTAFRASRPKNAGEPWTCGHCGGPLPDVGEERVVVRCVYCRTDQILGVDLPGRVDPAQAQVRDLEHELGYRMARRQRYRWLGVGAVAAALLGGAILREPLSVAFAQPSRNTRCVNPPPEPSP
jgi:DNA-directed RNA polymerase subunit RPC12/RpoP